MCCQSELFVLGRLSWFTALESCCLRRLKQITLLWEQWRICVPRWVSAERGKITEKKQNRGVKKGWMQTTEGPFTVSAGGSYSLHTRERPDESACSQAFPVATGSAQQHQSCRTWTARRQADARLQLWSQRNWRWYLYNIKLCLEEGCSFICIIKTIVVIPKDFLSIIIIR